MAAGPAFVPLTLPGELVRVRSGGVRAELLEILEPSGERQAPPCPHFGACGGCALQHWAHGPYLAWKQGQIKDALAREGIETEILPAFAAPPGSRRRVALHARPGAGGVRVGFKMRRSWKLAPIDICLVAHPGLVRLLPSFRALAAPLFEARGSAPILHATLTDTGVDVEISGVERRSGGLSADARQRVAAAAAAADLARVTMGGELIYQSRTPVVSIGLASVALPPGAFLQAVAEAEAMMQRFALGALEGARRIADLYCGVGAFALRLAERAQVVGYDVSGPAIAALAAAAGSAPGLRRITAHARDLERRPVGAAELKGIEAVVIDPPRAGAAAQHRELAASQVARVVGVSCNPATFARDARTLVDGGFRLLRAAPVDQFLWSPHVELVGLFERSGG